MGGVQICPVLPTSIYSLLFLMQPAKMSIMLSKLKKLLFSNKAQTPTDWITEMQRPLDPHDPKGLIKGQVELLRHFQIATELREYGWQDGWRIIFHGVSGREMIDRLVQSGLLIPASRSSSVARIRTKSAGGSVWRKVWR